MARTIAVLLILLGTTVPVLGKALCPPGRFTIRTMEPSRFDGTELVLGEGRALLADSCATARAGQFHRATGNWLFRIRARWRRCDGRPLALHARWDFTTAYCTRLNGVIRSGGGRRTAFVADRVPECGNGLRETGELCDGSAGTFFAAQCCTAGCGLEPGCPRLCDRDFACGAEEICGYLCGFNGVCLERATVDCGSAPVCGCDLQTTYADRCAAYDAGSGVSAPRPCGTAP